MMPTLPVLRRACLPAVAGALAWMVSLTVAAAPAPLIKPSGRLNGPTIVQQCQRLYKPDWLPVVGQPTALVPKDARPPKGLPVVDEAHRTCVVRVTDHDADMKAGFARNDYARRQAFNADNTRLIVSSMDGAWHLYATADFQYLGALPGLAGDAEPQWSPTQPNLLTYLPRNGVGMTIHELDVDTGRSRVVADLSKRLKAIWPDAFALWTHSEGSPSRDHRYWAFQVDDTKWGGLGLVSYDLKEDRIIATYDLARNKKTRPDHISMSPSGRYIVVPFADGVHTFRPDFSDPRAIARKGEHSDLALDKNGDDVFVSVDYEASGGPLYSVNLRTGKRTDLFKSYVERTATALHISGKAYDRPGWVIVSTYADYGKNGQQWLHRKVFAMTLDATPRIVNLAHHHSQHNEYFTEPQATPNRDMTRVLFNSNWGTQSKDDIDAFMVIVPDRAYAITP